MGSLCLPKCLVCLFFSGQNAEKRFLRLRDAVDAVLADSDEESADICILPPEDGRLSETEDIDEDNLLAEEPGDVSGVLEIFSA